jgi:hypothetical protein
MLCTYRKSTGCKNELAKLNQLHDILLNQKDIYKSNQVQIQIKAEEAWLSFYSEKKNEALYLMKTASDMEDSTSKHPATPGEVLPARELYADMLMEVQQYENALRHMKPYLKKVPTVSTV